MTQLLTLLHKDKYKGDAVTDSCTSTRTNVGGAPQDQAQTLDAADEDGIEDGDGVGDEDDGDFGILPLPSIADLPEDPSTDIAAEIEAIGHELYFAKEKYK